MKNKLILASASPRRLALLAQVGLIPDRACPADIDETPLTNELPRALATRLGIAKAEKIAQENHGFYILAADTVVACGRRILGKPANADEAAAFLRLLSGRRHHVYTGLALINPAGKIRTRLCDTLVQFKSLSTREIETYIGSGQWEDAAGAYAIQGRAEGFVKMLRGSYSNVVGLPLYDTLRMLEAAGFFQFKNM